MSFYYAGALGAASLFSSFQSSSAAKKQIRLQQEQYDRWKSIYGGVEENLSEYFNSITPSELAAQGIQQFDKQYTGAMDSINKQFEQSGVDPNSGLAQTIRAQGELGAAEQRAGIRQNAEQQVIQSQASFVQMGQGQGQQAAQGLAGAYNQQAQSWGQASGNFLNAGLNMLGDHRYAERLANEKGNEMSLSDRNHRDYFTVK